MDAAHVYTYAKMRLTPAIISATTGRTSKKVLSHTNSSTANFSSNLDGIQNPSGGSIPPPRPMGREKWWRGQDGFLLTNAWGLPSEGSNAIVPTVWFQDGKLQMYIYQTKQLTFILLIPVSHAALEGVHIQTQILEQV